MKAKKLICLVAVNLFLIPFASAESKDPLIERGRYLATVGGCNDCHTKGFAESGGKTSEEKWLMGDGVGWRGPWGTTYPANIRILVNKMDEASWITYARNLKTRPPMPFYVLNLMSDEDLIAFHRFVKHLGTAGQPVPSYVPPNEEPKTPYFSFVPVEPTKR